MNKQPWLKFYPADWRADPALKVSSLAARGLWVEMLAIMHEAEPRGCLAVKGRPVTAAMLATLVGSDENTVNLLLNELEQNGVFSRKKNNVIYSRRMELDENKARKNRENGKKGGNPTLCNQTEKQGSDNHQVKAKIPDTRYQIIEDTPNVVSSLVDKPSKEPDRFQEFWDAYPHRNGAKKGRGRAEGLWAKAVKAGVEQQHIISKAAAYARDARVLSGFVKDPTTWLNGKCWDDDIEVSQTVQPISAKKSDATIRHETMSDLFRSKLYGNDRQQQTERAAPHTGSIDLQYGDWSVAGKA